MMLWVLLIIGIVVLALALVVVWCVVCGLPGDIDQDREDWHGERRS